MAGPLKGVCFRIHGRVQGVGFRYFTRKAADELGVLGWVRNESNGCVLVHAGVKPEVLDAFRQKLKEGPRFGNVTQIEEKPLDISSLDPASGFQILR